MDTCTVHLEEKALPSYRWDELCIGLFLSCFSNLLLPEGVPAERPKAKIIVKIYRAEGLPKSMCELLFYHINFSLIRNLWEIVGELCQVEQRRGGCCEQRNVGVVVMSPARCWAFLVRVNANSQRAERSGASKVLSKFLKIIIIIYNHDDNEFCCFFFSFSVNSGLMANVKKAFTGEVK